MDGDTLYAFSSDGDLAALDSSTGRVRWQRNVRQEFGGESGDWAYAESPLVDGNLVVETGQFNGAALVGVKVPLDRWREAIDAAAYRTAITGIVTFA